MSTAIGWVNEYKSGIRTLQINGEKNNNNLYIEDTHRRTKMTASLVRWQHTDKHPLTHTQRHAHQLVHFTWINRYLMYTKKTNKHTHTIYIYIKSIYNTKCITNWNRRRYRGASHTTKSIRQTHEKRITNITIWGQGGCLSMRDDDFLFNTLLQQIIRTKYIRYMNKFTQTKIDYLVIVFLFNFSTTNNNNTPFTDSHPNASPKLEQTNIRIIRYIRI